MRAPSEQAALRLSCAAKFAVTTHLRPSWARRRGPGRNVARTQSMGVSFLRRTTNRSIKHDQDDARQGPRQDH
jgi:hypothetical protein